MSDLDKELNFTDIAGNKKLSKSEKKKPPKKAPEETGTVLWIPSREEDNTWIKKDLAFCTGEEFVEWAKSTYPVDISDKTEQLNRLSNRVREFKKILQYHAHSPFQLGRDNKKNTTLN